MRFVVKLVLEHKAIGDLLVALQDIPLLSQEMAPLPDFVEKETKLISGEIVSRTVNPHVRGVDEAILSAFKKHPKSVLPVDQIKHTVAMKGYSALGVASRLKMLMNANRVERVGRGMYKLVQAEPVEPVVTNEQTENVQN